MQSVDFGSSAVSPEPIPFNRFSFVGKELSYIQEAVERGHVSGDGIFTRRCHLLIERELGVAKALLTTSCTHALEIAALLLNLKPDDEVILPAFTFVSTANAFVLRGAKPVFVDIRPDTLNIDESLLERHITPRTRAIVVVHYAGVGCEMDAIERVAAAHGIPIVEDNAHGLFGRYRGRWLGTFGEFATLSFHETKNFSCGEGGALLIRDQDYVARAEIIREKGTNRSRFFRGQVDKYTWVDIGSSYLPSDILAAILFAQLQAREQIQKTRRRIWHTYYERLLEWSKDNGARLPYVPDHCDQPYHLFYVILPTLELRQKFLDHLGARSILGVFHYLPLHLSAMGRRFGGKPGDCSVTENISDRIVRLPFYVGFNEAAQNRVIEAIHEFRSVRATVA
jgi:dTDP-4-amino-4,6-dideoxygalactose transaminase